MAQPAQCFGLAPESLKGRSMGVVRRFQFLESEGTTEAQVGDAVDDARSAFAETLFDSIFTLYDSGAAAGGGRPGRIRHRPSAPPSFPARASPSP
jgi:hypothetical protein